ncbi:MAG: glycerol dehydrogenase [Oscillospiraceae bacterium]|nr:glycerol dehydrogenase [Oscillospiraceae bacterium]
MPEIKTFAAPSKYIQGKDLLLKISDYIGFLGNHFLVLTDQIVFGLTKDKIAQGFAGTSYHVEIFGGESTAAEAERIAKIAAELHCCCIVGLGGGKVIDTTKYAADLAGIADVIVPTAAASDAPCSAMSVVYDENGAFVVSKKMKHNPNVVLVDTQIITEAPVRLLKAGLGDAFATYYEARACKRSGVDNFTGGKRNEADYAMAELCNKLLLQYGKAAVESVQKKQWSEAVDMITEANIFLSGLGFENNGCAIAHAFYSGMTKVWDPFPVMHGEAVAVGVLVQLAAEYLHAGKTDEREWGEVITFYKECGLPTSLKDLGIEADEKKLYELAEATCTYPNSKKMPFDVTPESLYQAILRVNKNNCMEETNNERV